jgi:hypothetical protein
VTNAPQFGDQWDAAVAGIDQSDEENADKAAGQVRTLQ